MKVLITGAKGGLGCELTRVFLDVGHEVVALDREDLDVTDREAVATAVRVGGYGAVVNAAAYNDVDGAEDPANRERAFALNGAAPGFLAEAARDAGAAFVHYSTDYVFDGTRPEGYTEDDGPSPVSVYGESKLAGERAVRAAGGRWFIARVSKLFGRPGVSDLAKPGFLEVMRRLAATKPELGIVDEEVGTPAYVVDVARATEALLEGGYGPGIYHLVNEGPGVTWFGFAEEFFRAAGIMTPRKPLPSSAFPKPAQRPKFAPLRNTKFPPLRERTAALEDYATAFQEEATG